MSAEQPLAYDAALEVMQTGRVPAIIPTGDGRLYFAAWAPGPTDARVIYAPQRFVRVAFALWLVMDLHRRREAGHLDR